MKEFNYNYIYLDDFESILLPIGKKKEGAFNLTFSYSDFSSKINSTKAIAKTQYEGLYKILLRLPPNSFIHTTGGEGVKEGKNKVAYLASSTDELKTYFINNDETLPTLLGFKTVKSLIRVVKKHGNL